MARLLFLQEVAHEYLGVMSLSAYVKKRGHECDILIASEEGRTFHGKIQAYRPDAVAISVMTGSHGFCSALAAETKRLVGKPVIFGGAHATFFPEVIEDRSVDAVCRGEGEEPLADFLDAVDAGEDYSRIPNLWVRRDGGIVKNDVRRAREDLDEYPFGDRSGYYKYPFLRAFPTKSFLTGRGCPFDCSYCFNRELKALYRGKMRVMRRLSPEGVIEEVLACNARYPLERLAFLDDIFILQKDWLEAFAPLYRNRVNLPFSCNFRPELVDEDRVRLLQEAGCTLVMWGIETGSERLRRGLLNRQTSEEQIYACADLFHRYGFKIRTYNMLGLPGETIDDAVRTLEVNAAAKIEYPNCTLLQPYPRTKIAEVAQAMGVLGRDYSPDDLSKSAYIGSILRQPDIKRLSRLQKLFYLGAKNPSLIPFVKWISKYPLDPLFFLIWSFSFLIRFLGETESSLLFAVRFVLKHRRSAG